MNKIDQIVKLSEHFFKLAREMATDFEIKQEYLEAHPQELDAYLDKNKEYQKQWKAKQDPEKLKERLRKNRDKEKMDRANLKKSGTIDGLLLKLATQINDRKSTIVKSNNVNEARTFLPTYKQIKDLIFYIKEYLYGIHHDNPGFVAKPEQLFNLIEQSKAIYKDIEFNYRTIAATLGSVILDLSKISDAYSQK